MYRAPVAEIAFTLKEITGLSKAIEAGHLGELTDDLVDAILEEAGRFASEEIAPLNATGDREPARFKDGAVTMPPGWAEAYRKWCEGGWAALSAPEEFGGQGLPLMLQVAAFDIWNGASLAFALGPTLTVGAVEALHLHASDELKARYLAKLVSGEWTGTMNLTEPQAGTDLGALRCRAERRDDGTYRLFGQKIFITYGEHDMTDNIVHTVLARLPDAPDGTKGISLFLVPKYLVNEDGSLGARNDVVAASIEHKLGIHASPTCVMLYGEGRAGAGGVTEKGAVGYLIGEENRGLAAMFTMMNNARLMVGIEGVGIAERATQQASAYAAERRQGRAVGSGDSEMSPIIVHPDIRRTLLAMRGLTSASRAICYACAHAIDMAKAGAPAPEGAGGEKFWGERAALLTPIAKAFSTDAGVEVASQGIQVHGGMGFIEETGAAQHLRDARITPIYEGTNGVQAIDLVTRKLPLSQGEAIRLYLAELGEIAEAVRASNRPELGHMGEAVAASLKDCAQASEHLLSELLAGHVEAALAGATPFLRLFGLAAGGAYLARGALATDMEGGDAAKLRIQVARAFCERLARQTRGLKEEVVEGADAVLTTSGELLAAAS
ncbi:acyl-CoA dehydrogenase [Afifella sp. IM 167]|uniref:acyl-CoA dehydrogenase n=1 Tax=Afifella sp. IM 167 TaxID=2033586 RepID=UPI001CCF3594|nr:acyl-CoA dehydrogenase [Afifella sp. IM 167]MBZ8133425.1 acyl-CoA dehydrogenase [Afifella sp. IM 167]